MRLPHAGNGKPRRAKHRPSPARPRVLPAPALVQSPVESSSPPTDAPPTPSPQRAAGLYTIIAIKLGKGLLLLLLGLGIFSLVGDDLGSQFEKLLRFVRLDPEREFFVELGRRIELITPSSLKQLASGTLLYALLLAIESIGLMYRTAWAGWLAIGETAFFIPIEVLKLVHNFSWTVTVILVVNALIVLYLVRNRRRLFHHHHAPTPAGNPVRTADREDWEV